MQVLSFDSPGGPDVLTLRTEPNPVPGPGEVLIDVVASAVNRADLLQREGAYPPPKGAPSWPGLECSGVIAGLGEGVENFAIGDEVCALLAGGGYAEKVVVPAAQVLPIPDGVGLVEAAGLPEVAATVWSNVFMTAGLQRGETLLVHGGSSGIGTMAIQLAHALGCSVAVTAGSAAKLAACQELGADILVNYREQDFVEVVKTATNGHGADVVLDIMGAKYLDRNLDVLAVNGRIVVIGLQGGRKAEFDIAKLQMKRGAFMATTLRARPPQEKATIVAQVGQYIWPLIADGAVKPIIDSSYPLAEGAQAHRRVAESNHIGKVVLTVGQG